MVTCPMCAWGALRIEVLFDPQHGRDVAQGISLQNFSSNGRHMPWVPPVARSQLSPR